MAPYSAYPSLRSTAGAPEGKTTATKPQNNYRGTRD
jgi:hypothetical protein